MSIVGEITTGVASVFKILEVVYALKAVDEQTRDLLKLTQEVEKDIRHAQRLLHSNTSTSEKLDKEWMDDKISAAQEAVKDVTRLIEPCRVDLATTQGIKLHHRALWVFRDSSDVSAKYRNLQSAHGALLSVITTLSNREILLALPVAVAQYVDKPPPYDPELDHLYNRRDIRRVRSRSAVGDSAVQRKELVDRGPPEEALSSRASPIQEYLYSPMSVPSSASSPSLSPPLPPPADFAFSTLRNSPGCGAIEYNASRGDIKNATNHDVQSTGGSGTACSASSYRGRMRSAWLESHAESF